MISDKSDVTCQDGAISSNTPVQHARMILTKQLLLPESINPVKSF